MTIDSKYLGPEIHNIAVWDSEYYFNYESIGPDTFLASLSYVSSISGDAVYIDIPESNYTLTYGGEEPIYSRGIITFTSPTPSDNNEDYTLYVWRKTPITQELDLIPYTPAPMESVEFSMDKLTMILQEIEGDKCDCPWGGTAPVLPPEPPVGDCIKYGPISDVPIELTELRSATVGGTYDTSRSVRESSLVAVAGEVIWQNEPGGVGGLITSELYVSGDFGATWAQQIKPQDGQGMAQNSNYAAAYPDDLAWSGFKKINGTLWSTIGNWNSRIMGLYKTDASSSDATSWSLSTSPFNGYQIASPYYGTLSVIGSYDPVVGEADGSPIVGGRPAGRTDQGIKIGEWQVGNGEQYCILVNDFSLTNDAPNPSFIQKVGKYVYQRRTRSGGTFISALPYDDMLGDDLYRRYTNASWSGSSWQPSFGGTWRYGGNRNDEVLLTGLVSSSSWSSGISRRSEANQVDVLMAAAAGYADEGDANYGKFYSVQEGVPTLYDLSSLVQPEDPPNETDGTNFITLRFLEDAGYWALCYGFLQGTSVGPAYFYMRVSKWPEDLASWSEPVKYLLPDQVDTPRMFGGGDEGIALGYSNTRDAFVFSMGIQDSTSFHLSTCIAPSGFECIAHEGD